MDSLYRWDGVVCETNVGLVGLLSALRTAKGFRR